MKVQNIVRHASVLFALAIAGGFSVLTGCTATETKTVRTGQSLEDYGAYTLKSHDKSPNFSFVDDKGQMRQFREISGDITVVVFPIGSTWPDCGSCKKLATLVETLDDSLAARVQAVSIIKPSESVTTAFATLRGCRIGTDRLLSISDNQGQIHSLFGSQADGMFYVINQNQIVATGRINDWDSLDRATRSAVVEANRKPDYIDY